MKARTVLFLLLYLSFPQSLWASEDHEFDPNTLFPKGSETTIAQINLIPMIRDVSYLELRIKPSKRHNNHDYNFFVYQEGNSRWIARMITSIIITPTSRHLLFIGMEIKKKWRRNGLSRILTKTIILLSQKWNLEFQTGKLKKPALCRIMFETGLTADSEEFMIHIDKVKSPEGSHRVFCENYTFEDKFLISQNLEILDSPTENSFQIPYNTTYMIYNLEDVIEKLNEIGSELLYP